MAEKILVISTYPPKGSLYNHPSSAVAGYTKNTLSFANAKNDFSFTVLADILDQPEKYQEDGQSIIRCWQRNTPQLYFSLLKEIFEERKARKIFIAFEWAMFGAKKWLMAFLPLFLVILTLSGRKVYFVSHGVLLNASLVSVQMGITPKSFRVKVWTVGLRALYFLVVLLSLKVVVFEEYLRLELLKLINLPGKIVTIPHGVSEPVKDELKRVKEKKDFMVESFGFLIWYKGSDWLVKEAENYFQKNPNSSVKLVMTGGATKTYKDQSYLNYIAEIYQQAKNSKGKIKVTGFLDEKEIPVYYNLADLLVLPYRVLVSASGPLSLVFTYQKPFLISESLKGYLCGEDFSRSLKKAGLTINDLTFSFKENALFEQIETLRKDPKKLEKIKKFSALMFEERNWPVIGEKYRKILKDEKIS